MGSGLSIFNSLHYFHVSQPGLPPCLAHDLFEGVVACNLALMIHYFVHTVKWFSYDLLNSHIRQFPCEGADGKCKRCEVPLSGNKLGRQAAQNWVLLQLFGFPIVGLVIDEWQLYLKLCDFAALVSAPRIELGQDFTDENVDRRLFRVDSEIVPKCLSSSQTSLSNSLS
jgi:hypothetical protein